VVVKIEDGKMAFDFLKSGNLPAKRKKGKVPALVE